jgi:hypothetical protein
MSGVVYTNDIYERNTDPDFNDPDIGYGQRRPQRLEALGSAGPAKSPGAIRRVPSGRKVKVHKY